MAHALKIWLENTQHGYLNQLLQHEDFDNQSMY